MEAMNVYPIKNSKGEGGKKRKRKRKKGLSHKQSEALGGIQWVYKLGLQCPVIAMAITPKPHCLSLSP